MTTSAGRRGTFFGKENITTLDAPKSSVKDAINDRTSKYDQENLLNGLKNGSTNSIPDSYVGYSNIPNHAFRRAVRQGFDFNLMVVGETGLGKSTFINTLFLTDVYGPDYPGPSMKAKGAVKVRSTTVSLQEDGVTLRLSIIDTPGFGECVDNSECWKPIVDYIDARFDDYMTAEGRVSRDSRKIADTRVHACLYFLAPTGHRLKSLDAECLKRIQDKVNVIPVIGKADCLTPDECKEFKKNILADLQHHQIRIYDFVEGDKTNGETKTDSERSRMRGLRDRIPFAVVGANTYITNTAGNRVRARIYPWGTVEVENVEHNDFAVLSYYLIQLQMQNLREVTHRQHYENYRAAKLSGIAQDSNFKTHDGQDPMMLMDAEKREHEQKLRKMEADMEAVFAQKVAEKSQKQKEFEADLLRRAEQMREQLRQEEAAHEMERRAFEEQKARWEEAWREWDIGADLAHSTAGGGLGERVLSEVIKERSKTEKKRKGLF
ncbi:Septin-7 [Echinococcus granulosus]|uniref:Septin-7 n=1 Tax=Echinococcus granulosus TaxID=6210 RepID=U6JDW6_ECHGR|nr:Septin-7 [Echinococcus granulosus]EUB62015.1 Septin-7 [Echinococcus granulosus]KAH9284231.1 Septin-7 [Echinococcus granulosus]CDS19904.1 septin 7 [Echinococcus granulosus]